MFNVGGGLWCGDQHRTTECAPKRGPVNWCTKARSKPIPSTNRHAQPCCRPGPDRSIVEQYSAKRGPPFVDAQRRCPADGSENVIRHQSGAL